MNKQNKAAVLAPEQTGDYFKAWEGLPPDEREEIAILAAKLMSKVKGLSFDDSLQVLWHTGNFLNRLEAEKEKAKWAKKSQSDNLSERLTRLLERKSKN